MSEENKAVVRRFWEEVFNQGNLEVADALFAADHVLYESSLADEKRGPDAVKGLVALLRKISPGIRVTAEDERTEGNAVISRWTANGPLADELRNVGTNGDEVTISGISVFRISDGEIKETWQQSQRSEAQALSPPEKIRDWLLADQLISDLVGRSSGSSGESVSLDGGETENRVWCWWCGCCEPQEPPEEP